MKLGRIIMFCANFSIAATIASCGGSTPKSVREYALALPGRADGQYATLDEIVKKQLVMMDSLLQCKIDVEDKKTESDSAACKCSKSSSDWVSDCKGWLGTHTPAAAATGGH